MLPAELTGQSRSHIEQVETPRFAAHPEVVQAFMEMRAAAKLAGFELHPCSAFRDFKAQLRIWNMKYTGQRPLYSPEGKPLEFSQLSPEELIRTILYWSALPGASRHHWGTEIDVIDQQAMPEGYRVQLLPEEVEPGGIFHPMHCWLDKNMSRFGFFRPYRVYQGGVCPEFWHLSYAPLSQSALKALSPELLEATIQDCDIQGKQQILSMLPFIYEQYVLNIC